MAATDVVPEQPPDRRGHRRRPFSTWVKRLTNFKSSSDGDRHKRHMKVKRGSKLNNPYPHSGRVSHGHTGLQDDGNGDSAGSFATAQTSSDPSLDTAPRTAGGRSMAGTISTENETPRSITAASHVASSLAGTSRTVGGGVESRRDGDSTFSSPAPSMRSLTTTLTTIQSTAPNGNATSAPLQTNTQSIQFSQPFPSATSPASAIPAHLAPTGHPTTYNSATANNLLTDNASILTLASSSKRRRRRSMDTDASVRALAPSSLWGGSRESLPLSVLSSNVDTGNMATTPGVYSSSSRMGAERNSIYSATGGAPTIASERNSIYTKQGGDGASVRSGLLGQGGRPDSISGSTAGLVTPLIVPQEVDDAATADGVRYENIVSSAKSE